MGSTPEPLVARWCGRTSFAACLREQLETREAIIRGEAPGTLLLVEHPPTLTLGRRAAPSDVLWSDEELAERGVEVCETPRGGEATLHAPGQIVCYPIVSVGRQIRAHIVRLADVTSGVLRDHGVSEVEFRMETPGLFTPRGKIASIGIHVSRGVTVQGISINIAVDPTLFGSLISCGMPQMSLASLQDFAPKESLSLESLSREWAERYAEAAGYRLRWE